MLATLLLSSASCSDGMRAITEAEYNRVRFGAFEDEVVTILGAPERTSRENLTPVRQNPRISLKQELLWRYSNGTVAIHFVDGKGRPERAGHEGVK